MDLSSPNAILALSLLSVLAILLGAVWGEGCRPRTAAFKACVSVVTFGVVAGVVAGGLAVTASPVTTATLILGGVVGILIRDLAR